MPLFSKRKDFAVQSFVLKLVNNSCDGLSTHFDGPRCDSRVHLVVVVMILPVEHNQIQMDEAFTAVTKEFSNSGVAVVLDQPCALDEAILGFRFEGDMYFIRAKAKHREPMGGGFHQIGFHLLEVVSSSNYPELQTLCF
jgi:hypothetical protein